MRKKINPFQYMVACFLAAGLALLPIQSVQALSVNATWSVASTNSLLSAKAGTIQSISLTATGAVMTVRLIDMPSVPTTNLTYVIGAYTNYTPTAYTNTAAAYTDILGNSVTNTGSKYITNLATTVAASTNNYRTIGVYVVPANETLTINYDNVNPFVFGLGYTNVGGGSITVNYQPFQ